MAANTGAAPTSHEKNDPLAAAGHGYSRPLRRHPFVIVLRAHTLHFAPRWSCVLSFRHVPQALRGCCSSGRTALPSLASLWKATLAFSVSGESGMLFQLWRQNLRTFQVCIHWPSGCAYNYFSTSGNNRSGKCLERGDRGAFRRRRLGNPGTVASSAKKRRKHGVSGKPGANVWS